MTDSLRDQLLGLGFKPASKPERKPAPNARRSGRPGEDNTRADRPGRDPAHARPEHVRQEHGKPRPQGERAARSPHPSQKQMARPAGSKPDARPRGPRTREDIDLAKAYAIRAQREKEERIEAERLKQEEARKRREAKARLAELLKDKGLNDPAAEIARHFDYGGKIKRIYVNAAQLRALNAGELGVVQIDGRYLLVDAALLAQAEAIFAPAIALKVDPDAAVEDPYADPQYQVPDDLVW
jgi:uncharacterized protein YaiL (DUF2058 family)